MENRDVPISSLEEDEFGIENYINSLCEFIKGSSTPITIALQGEWGSGKSSFMSIIENKLCKKELPEAQRYDAIWLNTWDLFLENDYDIAVKKLIIHLLSQLEGHFDKLNQEKIKSKRKNLIKEYLHTISSTALAMSNLDNEVSERLMEKVFGSRNDELGIKDLKREFENYLVTAVREKENEVTDNAFLIFVDDLDRLDPKLAITLLEALKNLFDIKCCIFILAIDYEVIACGVEQKYGNVMLKNRKIEKDFFDKMIQVPYVIPMSQYHINPMVIGRLKEIHLFERDYDYTKYESILVEIFTLVTNKNPRAIKRYLNMVHLLKTLENRTEGHHGTYRVMEILLLGMQLSFPSIYNMLKGNSNLANWRKSIYIQGRTDITESERNKYQLDEEWKEVIYLEVNEDTVIKHNYYRVARLLEIYENLQSHCRKVGEDIQNALGIVNVISVPDNKEVEVRYDGEAYNKSSQTQFSQGSRLLDSLDLSTVENVLDVGCGSGNLTLKLWNRNRDMNVNAFDIAKSQIAKAKENYQTLIDELMQESGEIESWKGKVHFYVQDALEMDDISSYDLIISNATIHWIMKPQKLYTLLYQALVPGGSLAVHQGGFGTYKELHEMARKAGDNIGIGYKLKKWLFPAYYPPKEELEALLKEIGYADVRVESVYKDESSNCNLVDNFANASLIYYQKAGLTDEEYVQFKEEFLRLCNVPNFKMSSHRLYVYAKKQQ